MIDPHEKYWPLVLAALAAGSMSASIRVSAVWAGIGMAAGLKEPTAGLGAVGGYRDLARFTNLGGTLFVFALPDNLTRTAIMR